MSGSDSEEEKIKRKQVLEDWVSEYGDSLYAFAILRVGTKELAEDLVQEAFMSAYASYHTFEGRAAPRTWLISILKNKIIDHMRKDFREVDIVDPRTLEEEKGRYFNSCGDWVQMQQRWNRSPDSALEEKGFFNTILECIEHLPRKLRSLFVMRALDDLDTETICKNLSLSTTNLWVGMFRARMKMKDCLEKNWYNEG